MDDVKLLKFDQIDSKDQFKIYNSYLSTEDDKNK